MAQCHGLSPVMSPGSASYLISMNLSFLIIEMKIFTSRMLRGVELIRRVLSHCMWSMTVNITPGLLPWKQVIQNFGVAIQLSTPLILKGWSPDQQYQPHLWEYKKGKLSSPTLELLNQNLNFNKIYRLFVCTAEVLKQDNFKDVLCNRYWRMSDKENFTRKVSICKNDTTLIY